MTKPTTAQLQAEIEALRHNLELARNECDSAKQELLNVCTECAALKSEVTSLTVKNESLTTQLTVALAAEALQHGKLMRHAGRTNKIVEFDPMIPGDFARASAVAREIGGIVRRTLPTR